MEVEKRAIGALLLLSLRVPSPASAAGRREGTVGPRPRPGPEPRRPRESWAPPARRPPVRTLASPGAAALPPTACSRRPVQDRAPLSEPDCGDECECPRVSQAPGPPSRSWQRSQQNGPRTLRSRCSWAVRSEDAKCCPL